MFEKEAEEYLKAQCKKRKEEYVIRMPEVYIADIPQTFKDGAEFGYNKGYHDAEEHYMNVIDSQHKLVEESKANEWHNVADGDLPKDSNKVVLCICGGGFINGKINYVCRLLTRKEFSLFGTVYRWKEIVLPELKESE